MVSRPPARPLLPITFFIFIAAAWLSAAPRHLCHSSAGNATCNWGSLTVFTNVHWEGGGGGGGSGEAIFLGHAIFYPLHAFLEETNLQDCSSEDAESWSRYGSRPLLSFRLITSNYLLHLLRSDPDPRLSLYALISVIETECIKYPKESLKFIGLISHLRAMLYIF